jgi:hypothetical protein
MAWVLPNESPQWGVEHCPRIVPEHFLGYDMVSHEVGDAVGRLARASHYGMYIVLEIDEEAVRSSGVNHLHHC